jgi:ETC complex I subunit-like protein
LLPRPPLDGFTNEELMAARIYKPAKTAMQQGTALTREWVLEFVPDEPRTIEPLMGWTSSADTRPQVRMSFASKDEAVAFATREGIAFRLEEPRETDIRPKSYAENFKFGRLDRWTH